MCNNRCSGCLTAIAIGIIIGIIAGILYFLALIPLIIFGLIVSLGFSAVSLAIVTALAGFGKREIEKCVCFKGKCVLILSLANILISALVISLILLPLNIVTAILVGIAVALFIANLISVFQLISCVILSNCKCREME